LLIVRLIVCNQQHRESSDSGDDERVNFINRKYLMPRFLKEGFNPTKTLYVQEGVVRWIDFWQGVQPCYMPRGWLLGSISAAAKIEALKNVFYAVYR